MQKYVLLETLQKMHMLNEDSSSLPPSASSGDKLLPELFHYSVRIFLLEFNKPQHSM